MPEPPDRWSVTLEGVTLLDRYTVERHIGGGGMAGVYLARDLQLGTQVVVKVPHAALLAEAGFRERFERETRDLIHLQHPHIVRILARGEHDGLPFLVLPFLPGGSLGDRLRKAPGHTLSYDDMRPWLRDIARALDFIHQQGIVHRDLKPDNVLFDEHGHAYLSDFGIAKAAGSADTGLTATGTTPGSPAYMAPEQPLSRTLTGASDQYSLAATLYEALSGRPTFEGETAVEVLLRKQSETPLHLRECAPGVVPGVAEAVMRALARDPSARFESCEALVDAMSQGAPAAPATPTPEPPPAPVPTRVVPAPGRTESVGTTSTWSRSSTRALWVVFALLVCGVPLLILFSKSQEGEQGGAALETAEHEEAAAAAPEIPEVRAAPEAPTPAQAIAGEYVLDRERVKALLQLARERGTRRLPGGGRTPPRDELEAYRDAEFRLTVRAEGTFELHVLLPTEKEQVVHGVWTGEPPIIEFEPRPPLRRGPRGKIITRLRAEVGEGRIDLYMPRARVPLRKL